LSGDNLRHLELGILLLLVRLMNFLAHEQLELLQADIFVGLLIAFPSLAQKPGENFFISISPTLLVSYLI